MSRVSLPSCGILSALACLTTPIEASGGVLVVPVDLPAAAHLNSSLHAFR
jgi:hypothetical protein